MDSGRRRTLQLMYQAKARTPRSDLVALLSFAVYFGAIMYGSFGSVFLVLLLLATRSWVVAVLLLVNLATLLLPVPRYSAWFARLPVWETWHQYFSLRVYLDAGPGSILDSDASDTHFMYCFHPHGIFPMGELLTSSFLRDLLPQRSPPVALAANALFYTPIVRQIFGLHGCVPASDRVSAGGRDFAVVPGGIAEIFLAASTDEELYLRHHMGFVKMAGTRRLALVPIFLFGNNTVFRLMGSERTLSTLSQLSRRIRLSVFGAYGRWGMPIPFDTQLTAVIGKPIPVPITAETRTKLFEYEAELRALYEDTKGLVKGFEARHLHIN